MAKNKEKLPAKSREQYIAENSEGNYNDDLITFSLLDASTVKRRQREGDVTSPYMKSDKYLDIPKDKRWNTKQLNSKLLQGILNGDPVDKIAKSFVDVIGNNKSATMRNARTMITGAECSGRMDSYTDLADKGVIQKKVWIATPDDRTRASHLEIDGEERDIDEEFSNKLMYPADPDGDASEVYNCRCSIRDRIVGFKRADGSIKYVTADRGETKHDVQIAEEKERRAEVDAEAKTSGKIDLSNIPLSDDMREQSVTYSERIGSDDIDKFNKIFGEATYKESATGSYYDGVKNEVYISPESSGTTIFHESTHYFDYNQDYTITADYGHLNRIYDDDGNLISKEWEPKIVTVKEHAGFSEYIASIWDSYERDAEQTAMAADLQNFVEKVGTSNTYGRDRHWEVVKNDMDAIKAYLDANGVDRSDEDFVHLSDFISAISYDANLGSLGFGGHSYDYWVSGNDKRVSEIVAGYNLLKATGREDLIAIERDLAPNLMQMIEKEWEKIW